MQEEKIDIYKEYGISDEARIAIEAAKEEKLDVRYTRIADREYVYRPITRKEWVSLRERMAALVKEADDNQAEIDRIKEQELNALLELGKVYYEGDEVYAGVVETLSDAILISSGFGGVELDPVKL